METRIKGTGTHEWEKKLATTIILVFHRQQNTKVSKIKVTSEQKRGRDRVKKTTKTRKTNKQKAKLKRRHPFGKKH